MLESFIHIPAMTSFSFEYNGQGRCGSRGGGKERVTREKRVVWENEGIVEKERGKAGRRFNIHSHFPFILQNPFPTVLLPLYLLIHSFFSQMIEAANLPPTSILKKFFFFFSAHSDIRDRRTNSWRGEKTNFNYVKRSFISHY